MHPGPQDRGFTFTTSRPESAMDMEAANGQGAAAHAGNDIEPVSRHQVHQVVSTLVNSLISLADNSSQRSLGAAKSFALLAGNSDSAASEPSTDSEAARSTGTGSTLERTALLEARFSSHDYSGDEVLPFYADRADLGDWAARGGAAGPALDAGLSIPEELVKRTRVDWLSSAVFAVFCLSLCMYVTVRAWKTLGLGNELWYGILILTIEAVSGVATLAYGLCLLYKVVDEEEEEEGGGAPEGAITSRLPSPTAVGYHLRVVVTCYKEPLEVVSKTVVAALLAWLPPNCRRTVYLLDDGRDSMRRAFIRSLGNASVVYVSGRQRAKGEVNGKSGNINSAMRQLYPTGVPIPLDEVVCVFDADQAPNADFFTKMAPLLDGGQDVGMALSPQTFYNLNADGDVFNHANVHFWNYSQPGYDALGLISCTGTNFLLRARAFQEAGWFPEWTLTEDFALGIDLMRLGWQCRYHEGCLAVGEAPEAVRNCFQQRSRWAKGHFQVFFSRHNPTFGAGAQGLSPLARCMLASVFLSYFSTMVAIPVLIMVPLVMVWFGAFPIVLNFWAALSITVYYAANSLILYRCTTARHLKSMWFTGISNAILWFAFLKALIRTTVGSWVAESAVFKATAKGRSRLEGLPVGDLWMSALLFLASLTTFIIGMVHYFSTDNPASALPISLCLVFFNLVPQYLLLQYAAFRQRAFFSAACRLAMLLSTAAMVIGVALLWVLAPKVYDYKARLGDSLFFIDSQRIGPLPADFRVPWRKSSFLNEASSPVYLLHQRNDTACPLWAQVLASALVNGKAALSPSAAPAPARAAAPTPGGRKLLDSTQDLQAAWAQLQAASTAASSAESTALQDQLTKSVTADATQIAFQDWVDSQVALITEPACQQQLNNTNYDPAPATPDPWDLSGGWMSGMAGGNIKATSPIAFTTTQLAWAFLSFPDAFQEAGQTAALVDSVRWGSDYLSRVHQPHPELNTSLLVTHVGDVWTEAMLWYRPEDSQAAVGQRLAVAVDLATANVGGDLGGSVAAALAAGSIVLASTNNATDLAQSASLLAAAEELYNASMTATTRFGANDFNITLLYNSTSLFDDLAWGAAWLYRATGSESYLADVYTFYEQHLEAEGQLEEAAADAYYLFDWDKLFWALNVMLAQQTGAATFKAQSQTFLDNWVCPNRAVNYTLRGRAYNPAGDTLGTTANAAFAAMVYADVIEAEDPSMAAAYKCWGMGQVRAMLGDTGVNQVVGSAATSPTHTQDRAAACPAAPAVCNRITGLLSPTPDTYTLAGALIRGMDSSSDGHSNSRSDSSAEVGIENNAGWTGALAGASRMQGNTWEACLRQHGMVHYSSVCGEQVDI